MRIIEIDDADDPRVEEYTGLTDMDLRLIREPADGLFMAEGQKVIARALGAGLIPRSALMERKWLGGLRELEAFDIDVYVADAALLKAVTGYRLHRGALAAFGRPALPSAIDLLTHSRRIVVLENLVDHTNVGLIFRSAAGLGADAILVSPSCADPFYRRSVKVSMGAVLTVPWAYAHPWPWVLDDLRSAGFTTVALTPSDDAVDLRSWQSTGDRIALILGTEGAGLSAEVLERVDVRIRIPMAGGVDSLNVAATAAVACFALMG